MRNVDGGRQADSSWMTIDEPIKGRFLTAGTHCADHASARMKKIDQLLAAHDTVLHEEECEASKSGKVSDECRERFDVDGRPGVDGFLFLGQDNKAIRFGH